jgi:hypothetical protein
MTARPKWSAGRVKSVIAQDQVDTLPTSHLSPNVNVIGSKLAPIPVPRYLSCQQNPSIWFGGVIEIDRQMIIGKPRTGALGPLNQNQRPR